MQRFLQAIHDTNGVTACNKHGRGRPRANGVAHPRQPNIDIPTGPANSVLVAGRPRDALRQQDDLQRVRGLQDRQPRRVLPRLDGRQRRASTSATTSSATGSAGVGRGHGRPHRAVERHRLRLEQRRRVQRARTCSPARLLGHERRARRFRPKPGWLNRLVFFDLANDSPTPAATNYTTNHFLTDLQGARHRHAHLPRARHPRPVRDAAARAAARPTSRSNGMIARPAHLPRRRLALPARPGRDVRLGGPRLLQRHHAARDGVRDREQPEDGQAAPPGGPLHRADGGAPQALAVGAGHAPNECTLADSSRRRSTAPRTAPTRYEPLLAQIFSSDMLTALHDLVKIVEGHQRADVRRRPTRRRTSAPSRARRWTASRSSRTRPTRSSTRRRRRPSASRTARATSPRVRNDGTTNPQVTPLYLVLETLNEIDAAFAAYAQANPNDTGRQAQWQARALAARRPVPRRQRREHDDADASSIRRCRGSCRVLIDVAARAARGRTAAGPPYGARARGRARSSWTNASTTIGGPTFAAAMDLNEAIRQNDAGRAETEKLLAYLLDAGVEQRRAGRAAGVGRRHDPGHARRREPGAASTT